MTERILGVDAGSVNVSVVEVDGQGRILRALTRAHAGDVEGTLARCLDDFAPLAGRAMAATESVPAGVGTARRVDSLVAAIRAGQALHPGLGALLVVGGERFSLSLFRPDGSYRESRFNSICAAGTGSFLDQQAVRLGLADSAALAELALSNGGDRPRIATRCAVFAKTDLIHAQQEGYSLEAICDGLCRGLAANVHDALFAGQPVGAPIVFAGGVARNRAVTGHLNALLGRELLVDEHAGIYGAYGAALDLLTADRAAPGKSQPTRASLPGLRDESAWYPPLELSLSAYPDFRAAESFLHRTERVEVARPVEVDVYRLPAAGQTLDVILGVDIGSTSTKAVLLDALGLAPTADEGPAVVAGFYTRTAGRPLQAVQAIFETATAWAARAGVTLNVRAAGTTGSGRKFIGALIGADLVLDEISAHARAACTLDPEVDTIIEIGGQDAKFTTLSGGMVTLSIMNHVCAAGTGSFIEEQAQRLDCPLTELSERTLGRRAPRASDRCTVFMERDINHFLADGCELDEALCAVLHAVRDNYLLKVAREGQLGQRICFQGATAKNRALVAAFEQKLGQPIGVSRYCHLTGALGVALVLAEEALSAGASTGFRGLDLYREEIPVRAEICELCHNNCKLRLAEVRGESVGYGYLCGRDGQEDRYVSANKAGFDLLRARRKHFRVDAAPPRREVTIGLPAALHLMEDLPLWQTFFAALGVRTVSSERLDEPVGRGKRLASAEFCAPMAAWHAHVASLLGRADFIFAPFYLEAEHDKGERRLFCYYTQFAPALLRTLHVDGLAERCLTPLVHIGDREFGSFAELHASLKTALGSDLKRSEVVAAWERAQAFMAERRAAWQQVLSEERPDNGELAVVLLGRPYTVLSRSMNSAIPDILAAQGIKAFYQDMLPESELGEVAELAAQVDWEMGKRLLAAAERVAKSPGLYPILLTSFKCAPDSCTIEYFRRVMNAHSKPYLILQLDEHDSQVGYETRIEAALRAFSNHHKGAAGGPRRQLPRVPRLLGQAAVPTRTMFLPNWDPMGSRLFVAGLREVGVDAHLLYEDQDLIQKSLGHNTGQCIPLNIIVEEFAAQVEREGLDPAHCALWMPDSNIGCNLCFFPQMAKGLLEARGGGFEAADVYAGELTGLDFSAGLNTYHAYMLGGMLRRLLCRVRPYEVVPGQADAAAAEGLDLFEQALLGELPKRKTARQVVERFLAIETEGEQRPLVAVFGDLYARDNDVFNQDLGRVIEAHGGELVTTPYSEYMRIIAGPYLRKWMREGLYVDVLKASPFVFGMELLEWPFRREFERLLGPRPTPKQTINRDEWLARFGLRMHHTGESFDNLLKIAHLLELYPDISLFVQTNPAFCCPSLVTEAMAAEIERQTGVPVVTITYDGTASPKNHVVIPYLELSPRRPQSPQV